MKKLNLKRMLNLRSLALVGIFAVAILATSCSDEMPEPAFQSVELKKGKPEAPGQGVPNGEVSIAEVAIGNGFTKLVDALFYVDEELDAGLVSLFLEGKDQYTVFAPTDEAFMALFGVAEDYLGLPDESITSVRVLPAEVVLAVLQYHVTDGRRAANSVVPKNGSRTIETLLEGATFSVNPDLSIDAVGNSANIEAANIFATNGIVHVIDAVILPITLGDLTAILDTL